MMAARRGVAKEILTALLALALATAGCAGSKPNSPPAATSPTPPPANTNPAAGSGAAALVEEVERELNAMRVTRYQHTTAVDEGSGSYFYDCSGLLDYAMGRVRPADLTPVPHIKARPLAADIEGYLHRGLTGPIEGWQALARVDGLGPGDVVAWQATEDSTTGDTGHVMVVPYAHVADLAAADPEALSEMMRLAQRVKVAMEKTYRPEGYNLGMNLGRAAGAGVTGHLHLHVLPRWSGDSNFMTVVGETRVEPEDLATTYEKLRSALA